MHFRKSLVSALFLLIAQCSLNVVQADLLDFSAGMDMRLSLTNGYRQDRISTVLGLYDYQRDLLAIDELYAWDIPLYQIGVKGQLTMCHWRVRAEADYARGSKGSYLEKFTTALGTSRTTANVSKATDWVANGGAGYVIPLDRYFKPGSLGVAPMVGWAYQHQQIKINKAFSEGSPDPFFDGVSYDMCWQGPWVGIDLIYRRCDVCVEFGYAYHWATWQGNWKLAGADVFEVLFSDRRKSNQAYANVIYLDGTWQVYSNWIVGVGVKFQAWKAGHGRMKPQSGFFSDVGFGAVAFSKVDRANWYSYDFTFDIGYDF